MRTATSLPSCRAQELSSGDSPLVKAAANGRGDVGFVRFSACPPAYASLLVCERARVGPAFDPSLSGRRLWSEEVRASRGLPSLLATKAVKSLKQVRKTVLINKLCCKASETIVATS